MPRKFDEIAGVRYEFRQFNQPRVDVTDALFVPLGRSIGLGLLEPLRTLFRYHPDFFPNKSRKP